MIGAQRARIFIRMGQVAEKLDLTPFQNRSSRLFSMIESSLDVVQKIKLRQALMRHIKRCEPAEEQTKPLRSDELKRKELTELMYNYVWTTAKMGRLGRPNSSADDYQNESEAKIAFWKRE